MTVLNLSLLSSGGPLAVPASSGAYTSLSVTAYQIIRQAMLDIGALSENEQPTQVEYSDCLFKLNLLAKQWMGDTDFAPGFKIWTRRRSELFLGYSKYLYNLGKTGDHWVESTTGLNYPQTYGQTNVATTVTAGTTVIPVASVTAMNVNDYIGILLGSDIFWTRITAVNPVPNPPTVTISTPGLPAGVQANGASYVWWYTTKAVRPLSIVACVLRDIYVQDTPLRIFKDVTEYESLPTKASPQNIADPTAILYEPVWNNQQQNGQLYLDVGGAQDVTKHLHVTFLAPTQDFVNPGDAPDYPQEWYRPLVLGHGRDIAGMFDCAWTEDLEANFKDSLAIARQANPKNSAAYFCVNDDDPYGP